MIFGTDGIRAPMDEFPLDRVTIEKLSRVLSDWLPRPARVVLGMDSRASCERVKAWIYAYLSDIQVLDLGLVPTPVVAFETRARAADLGIMITASHNPARDNGLKFFDRRGLKLPYDVAELWSAELKNLAAAGPARKADPLPTGPDAYRSFICEHFKPEDFRGLRVGFDFAHGAGSVFLRECIKSLEMEAEIIGDRPNGSNINQNIGALHPGALSRRMRESNLDVGFALDGDGDRLVVLDPEPLHGDLTLYALYRVMGREGVPLSALVGTILCGMGLERKLAEEGVSLIRTPVGDQHVLAEMIKQRLILGGEPSGHLIQGDLFPAGDGFLGALRLARALRADPNLLKDVRTQVPLFPVLEKSFQVRHKPALEEVPEIRVHLNHLKTVLAGRGRIILRYSGTEPKIRLFLEAENLAPLNEHIQSLERVLVRELT